MSFQFIHVEAYSRKASSKVANRIAQAAKKSGRSAIPDKKSMGEVIDEAERLVGSCPHVESPEPLILLFGVMPRAAEVHAVAWAEATKDAKGRSLRSDGLCIAAGVISAPASISAADWVAMKSEAIDWLKKKYGDQLQSVIEHTDEAHPHLHFYVVPKIGQRFESVDFGRAASKKAADQGLTKGQQNEAYKVAMRQFQDDFFQSVAMKFGLARIGPARRRLTRQAWRSEQTQAQALQSALSAASTTAAESEAVKAAAMLQAAAALAVQDEIERRAQLVLSSEKKLSEQRKSLKSAFLRAEKSGYAAGLAASKKIGASLGAVLGAAGATARRWFLAEKHALAELRVEIVRAEISARQEIKKASIQASEKIRNELSKLLKQERIESARLRADLVEMNAREDRRIEKQASVRRFLAVPELRLTKKIGE